MDPSIGQRAVFSYKNMATLAKLSTYIKDSLAELKKVVWPTKNQLINYTIVVIGMAIGIAVFFSALDYVFNIMLEFLIS